MRSFKPLSLVGPDATGGLGRSQRLHLGGDTEGIEQIGDRKLRHLKSLASPRHDKPAGCQTLQRFPHGSARHAVLLGQLTLVETIAGLALTFEDFNFQTMYDAGRQRFRLFGRTRCPCDGWCARDGFHELSAE